MDGFWAALGFALERLSAGGEVSSWALRLAGAALVGLATWWLARWLGRLVRRALARVSAQGHIVLLATQMAHYGVLFLGLLATLGVLGLSGAVLAAVAGVATLALALSIQDLLRNFAAGIYLLLERPFAPGDRIRVGDQEGRVEGVGIRATSLRTEAGHHVLVPNLMLFTTIVVIAPPEEARA